MYIYIYIYVGISVWDAYQRFVTDAPPAIIESQVCGVHNVRGRTCEMFMSLILIN